MTKSSELGELVKIAATIFGATVAAMTIVRAVSGWWKNGPGRRREWMRKYGLIALKVHIDYVRQLFGQPAFQERYEGQRLAITGNGPPGSLTPADFVEHVWFLHHEGYLHVLTDPEGAVVRYSLTSASRRFRPKIPIGSIADEEPEFVVKLGVTRFADLPWLDGCHAIYRCIEARRYEYRELYYYGNPGGYVDWVCSYNDAGCGPRLVVPLEVDDPPWWPRIELREWIEQLDNGTREHFRRARSGTVVNTVTLSAMPDDRSNTVRFGPDLDRVRMVRQRGWLARHLRGARRLRPRGLSPARGDLQANSRRRVTSEMANSPKDRSASRFR